MEKRSAFSPLPAVLFAVFLVGCAHVTNITDYVRTQFGSNISFIEPPESDAIFHYSSLSVTSDNNQLSQKIASKVVGDITSLQVLDKPFYELEEDADGVEIAITNGQVEVATRRISESRFECPGSGTVRRCSSDEAIRYQVSCQVRKATGTAELKMTDTVSGETVVAKRVRDTAEDKLCSDAGSNASLSSGNELTGKVLEGLKGQVIGPYVFSRVSRPFDLRESSDLMSEADNSRMAEVIAMASDGNFPEAIAAYQELMASHPGDGALLFNLAYLQHAVGRYADAVSLYDRAVETEQLSESLIMRNRERANGHLFNGYQSIPERQFN